MSYRELKPGMLLSLGNIDSWFSVHHRLGGLDNTKEA